MKTSKNINDIYSAKNKHKVLMKEFRIDLCWGPLRTGHFNLEQRRLNKMCKK